MYNSQEIALKIKETAKTRKISIKQLLEKCDLNINYISELGKGKQASALNISKIADCLEVSTDYLLGRTDNKNGYNNNTIVNNGNTTINDSGIQANVVNNQPQQIQFDSTTIQVAEVFQSLNFTDKAKVISLLAELSQKGV